MTFANPELRFAAAVSYLAATPEGRERQRKAIDDAVTAGLWPQDLFALIQRHRIPSLALAVLRDCDRFAVLGSLLEELKREDADSRQRSLLLAMRGGQARRALLAAGIPCLEFKGGPKLSRKLYGDIALRTYRDMDLMVPAEHFFDAEALLIREGWKSEVHPIWKSAPHYRALAHYALWDSHFTCPQDGSMLELHTRFERHSEPRYEKIWWDAMKDAPEQGISPAEFLYLVQHGTKHLWKRTKWLGDIAAILDRWPEIVNEALPLAQELRLFPALAPLSTLLLELYGQGFELTDSAKHPSQDQRFYALYLTALRSPNSQLDTTGELSIHWLRRNAHQLLLKSRLSWRSRFTNILFQYLLQSPDIEAWNRRSRIWLPLFALMSLRRYASRVFVHVRKTLVRQR